MVIQCEKCDTRFRLPDEKLKPEGVKVRCSHCKEVFTVYPPSADAPAAEEFDFADASGGEPSGQDEDFGDFAAETPSSESASGFDFDSAFSEGADESDLGFDAPPAAGEAGGDDFSFGGGDASGGDEFDMEESAGAEASDFSFDFDQAPASQAPAPGTSEFSFEEESWGGDSPGTTGGGGAAPGIDTDFGFDEEPPSSQPPVGSEFKFTELPGGGAAAASPSYAPSMPQAGPADLDFPSDNEDFADSVPGPPAAPKKSSSSGVLTVCLFLLLILGGAAAFFFWKQGQLPVVDQLLRQLTGGGLAAAPAGRVDLEGLEYLVVSGGPSGDLFVIRGRAVNRFPEARSAIQVKGALFNAQGQVIRQQTVYCGNPLDDAALRSLPFTKVQEAMNNQFGEALSNLNVPSGKSISFTIAFNGVPAGLAEYTVEVVDSQPVSK